VEEIFKQLKPLIIALTLCTPRMLTAFLISPFFNSEMITGATRNCIVMVFTLIVFPTLLPFVRANELALSFVFATVVKEAVIGALIGYLASLFFYAIEAVGHIIDTQRGAAFASLMDPTTGTQTTPMGSLLTQVTILLFFTSGGFFLFLSGMYESYRVWPIDTYWPHFDPEFAHFFLARLDDMMALGFLLASPILITLFLSELGLGLINRFAPQLNVFFLAMPVKSGVGLLILILYLQFLLTYIQDLFIQRFDIFGLLRQVVH
jgi:type III secretion protein T